MRVGLFVPCYVDQLYPDVGMATLELLEQLGCEVDYPEAQTCCGQPMANTGCWEDAKPLAQRFIKIFGEYDYVVCPSGSCVSMVVNHYHDLVGHDEAYEKLRGKVYELSAFLIDVLKIAHLTTQFPYKVGIHQSCHGLRELRLGQGSERNVPAFNKTKQALELCGKIELTQLKRPDECCGFGGTFAVTEEAVSCMMGRDRIQDHLDAGTEVMTAGDMSCLMHLQGIIEREKHPIVVMHLAQVLVGRAVDLKQIERSESAAT
jgi:L-lactate dehydrogenase complex protein LldE